MKSYLFLRFAQYRAFWNTRRIIRKVAFLLTSRLYGANQSLKETGKDSLFLFSIVRVTAKPWFWAIVVAAALQLGNPCLSEFFGKHGFSILF
jgi:hypothetical protein